MNVFDLDAALLTDYARFARSFTQIRAPDIREQVEAIYATNHFWPEPLISINPRFAPGASIEQLARDGTLHAAAAQVFRVDGKPLSLYRHQAQAVAKAAARQSFVVTTGTGSGKSLCFFVPIVDAAVRARAAGEAARTRAIIIYPMNALANSQIKELEKYIDQAGLPGRRGNRWNFAGALQPNAAQRMPNAVRTITAFIRHFAPERNRLVFLNPAWHGGLLDPAWLQEATERLWSLGAEVVCVDSRSREANGLFLADFFDFT